MRILLVKTSSLGDVVHNLPVVDDILSHHPGARVDWLVEESFVDIPRLHPGVDCTIPVAIRRWRKRLLSPRTWQEIAAFRRMLRAERYACVIDTQGLLKSGLLVAQARLIGGGRRCGHGARSAKEPLCARFYDDRHDVSRSLHAVERNRMLVAACLGYAVDTPLSYGLAAPGLVADWLPHAPHAVLLTATSRDDKLWPEDNWVALGKALAADGLVCVLPAGNAVERERAQRIACAIPGALPAPPLGVAALAGLLAGSRRVIGVDTGLTHLAAALGVPTTAIYSATDPRLTGVHAGTQAINLGSAGNPPDVSSVLAAGDR